MQGTDIRVGHFKADGGLHNLELGFVPNYFRIVNADASAGDVDVVEWWGETNKEIQHKKLVDNGSTGNSNHNYEESSGIISEYSGSSSNSEGVTIAASFMEDNDECYYLAMKTTRAVDHGDIA